MRFYFFNLLLPCLFFPFNCAHVLKLDSSSIPELKERSRSVLFRSYVRFYLINPNGLYMRFQAIVGISRLPRPRSNGACEHKWQLIDANSTVTCEYWMTCGTYMPNLNQHSEYINYSPLTQCHVSQNLTVARARSVVKLMLLFLQLKHQEHDFATVNALPRAQRGRKKRRRIAECITCL